LKNHFIITHFENPASPQIVSETYTGPISWSPEDKNAWSNIICSQGNEQSPIDLSKDTSNYEKLQVGYVMATHYQTKNFNLAIQDKRLWYADMTNGGFIIIQYKNIKYKYDVVNFSIHYDSEHTFDGKHSDVEIQIVHLKDGNYLRERGWRLDPNNERDTLNISIRFEVGQNEDSNFSKINIKNKGPTLDGFDLNKFVDTKGSFYFYSGSDTLPPCTQDVYWIIMEKTFTITQSQLDEVKSWIKTTTTEKNARSVKKLNNRVVYYIKTPHDLSTDVNFLFGRTSSSQILIPRLIEVFSLILLLIV